MGNWVRRYLEWFAGVLFFFVVWRLVPKELSTVIVIALGCTLIPAVILGREQKKLADRQTELDGKLNAILEKLNEQKIAN